ncbi:MAG: hypothetical protein ABH882_02550 [Candidatus Omnitrophota bacterium]|nr:hypothetical protein [Candidatus Omnitrophota bacterium]MBU1928933.1 hypothetical protein [Candidatus Omnitrophota bacterium]MBU2035342.1 hypothetical protein [Candidatus Omnitrophota bacterium]MBU2222141.1 hypothetical protein [Candidatus Omnitrophota bacterium]MBU2257640.1 hypothetical protein [Candidatus Omnitrophota bacterium]
MSEVNSVFDVLEYLLFWVSPAILLAGVLIFFSAPKPYDDLEDNLGREIGGIRKKILPALETNVETFHKWLLTRRKIIGFICIIGSILIFAFFRR